MIKDSDLQTLKERINKMIDEKRVKSCIYTVEHKTSTIPAWDWEIINDPQYCVLELQSDTENFKLTIQLR